MQDRSSIIMNIQQSKSLGDTVKELNALTDEIYDELYHELYIDMYNRNYKK